jgi:hypothetical protein
MAKSRLSMRREVEAADELEKSSPKKKKATKKAAKKKATKKKKTTATRTRRKAADTPVRRRLVWVVYSSTMREEGRYLYHDRDKAEEKLNALLAKGKRRYFIQPIKEPLDSEGNPLVPDDDTLSRQKLQAASEEDESEDTEPSADADSDSTDDDSASDDDDVPVAAADDD